MMFSMMHAAHSHDLGAAVSIPWALVAALANVVGALAITSWSRWSKSALESMIAISAGFMVSVAVVEMIPQAIINHDHHAAWVVLGGYLLVHLTQHTLAPHFHFGEETHNITRIAGVSALIGLMLHTFVDGVAVASGFSAGTGVGTMVLVAIILHKLPEGAAIASMFLASGLGRGKALWAGIVLGITTMLGAVFTEVFDVLNEYGLALAAGVTLYVATSNLVPEFQHKRGWRLATSFFAGCALFYVGHLLLEG